MHRGQRATTSLLHLPEEIVLHVLDRLTGLQLSLMSLVCKYFRGKVPSLQMYIHKLSVMSSLSNLYVTALIDASGRFRHVHDSNFSSYALDPLVTYGVQSLRACTHKEVDELLFVQREPRGR